MGPLEATRTDQRAWDAFASLERRLLRLGRGAARLPTREGVDVKALIWERTVRIDRFFAWQAGIGAPPWRPYSPEAALPEDFWRQVRHAGAGVPPALNWYEVCAAWDESARWLEALVGTSAPADLRAGAVWTGAWSLGRWIDEAGPKSAASAEAALREAGL